MAMARCSGENVSLWTGCAHHPRQVTLERENCSCNLTNVLLENTNGQSSLGEIGSLPTSAGGTISFNPTALPTYAVTTTGTPSSGSSGAAGATATDSASSGGSDGLSTGATAGVAVGSVIGGLLVLGVLAFLFRRAYRRRLDRSIAAHTSRTDSAPPAPPQQPSPMSQLSSRMSPAPQHNVDSQLAKSEEEGKIAGLGYKSEMPTESNDKPELAGDLGIVAPHARHELAT